MFLTPFDFIIKHRLGKINLADGLLRIPNSEKVSTGAELLSTIQDRIVDEERRTINSVEAAAIDEEHRTVDLVEVAAVEEERRAINSVVRVVNRGRQAVNSVGVATIYRPIQDRIVDEERRTIDLVEAASVLIIQEIISIKSLDVDYEHDL